MAYEAMLERVLLRDELLDYKGAEVALKRCLEAENVHELRQALREKRAFWQMVFAEGEAEFGEAEFDGENFLENVDFDEMKAHIQNAHDKFALRALKEAQLLDILQAEGLPILPSPPFLQVDNANEVRKTAIKARAKETYLEKKIRAFRIAAPQNFQDSFHNAKVIPDALELPFEVTADDISPRVLWCVTEALLAQHPQFCAGKFENIPALIQARDTELREALHQKSLHISSQKITFARGVLARQYLKKQLRVTLDLSLLKKVMLAETPKAMQDALLAFDSDKHFLDAAIDTEASVTMMRQVAAHTFLNQKLAMLSETALSALATAKTSHDVYLLFHDDEGFGLKGMSFSAIQKFVTVSDVNAMRDKAKILKHFVSNPLDEETLDQSKLFINLNNERLGDFWQDEQFEPKLPANFFQNANNCLWAKQVVATSIFKVALRRAEDLSDVLFQDFYREVFHGQANEAVLSFLQIEAFKETMQAYFESEALRKTAWGVHNLANLKSALNGEHPFGQQLPPYEGADFKCFLVEKLLSLHDNGEEIADLAEAFSMTAFLEALRKLGVTDLSFVTPHVMVNIQKVAAIRALTQKMGELGQKRPHFLNFLKTLPLEKQQEILRRDEIIAALKSATTEALLQEILKVPLSDRLKEEINHHVRCDKILNAALGDWMKRQVPFQNLTDDKVDEINQRIQLFLSDPAMLIDLRDDEGLQTILQILNVQPLPQFEDAVKAAIREDAKKNQILFGLMNSDDIPSSQKAFFAVLATITKGEIADAWHAEGEDAIYHRLFNAFQTARNLSAFKDAIGDFSEVTQAALKDRFTPSLFDDLKAEISKDEWQNAASRKQRLTANEAMLKPIETSIQSLKKAERSIKQDLQYLGNLQMLSGLDPAFQAVSLNRATEDYSKYLALRDNIQVVYLELKEQKNALIRILKGFPEDVQVLENEPGGKDAIEQKKHIENLLAMVEASFLLYERALLTLEGQDEGTAFQKRGILKTLEAAKENRQDVHLTAFKLSHPQHVTYRDFPKSHEAEYLSQRGSSAPNLDALSDILLENVPHDRKYDSTPDSLRVDEHHFREYTLHFSGDQNVPQEVQGQFIETRFSDDLKIKKESLSQAGSVEPRLRLIARSWPTIRNNPKATHEARVEMAMLMATRMLAARKSPPSKKEPMILKDFASDPIQAEYLWTALMVLGESHPSMKFNEDAIKVISVHFKPYEKLSNIRRAPFVSRFSDKMTVGGETYYFKKAPIVSEVTEGFKTLAKDKLETKAVKKEKNVLEKGQKLFQKELRDLKSREEHAKAYTREHPSLRGR